jgi:membrane protease YdiL (CAAX protease family)
MRPPADAPPATAPDPSSNERPRRSRRFSATVTVFFSIVVALYIGLLGRPLVEPSVSPLAELEHPEQSLDRLATRELDLRAALKSGPRWEGRLYRALSGDDDPLAAAADAYRELLDLTDSPMAFLHRAILLGELGRTTRLRAALEGDGEPAPVGERAAAWIAAAYLEPPPAPATGRAMINQAERDLSESWFRDTLVRRIAHRIGDSEARARAEAAILARGRALLVRARALMLVSIAFVAAGAIALVWMLRAHLGAEVARAPLPPPWTPGDGYALFVRGLGAPQTIALVGVVVLRQATGLGTILGMAADLPLFLWVAAHLHARGTSMREAFGLVPRGRGWARLVAVTFVLIAVALVSDVLIELASRVVNLKTHWTDGFTEELLWSGRRRVVLEAIDASAWAPIVEEITFRGLLYGTLRLRLKVPEAALVSAVVFTLPHGYAVAGSASVLVSGLLWAVAYERTRSLLPGLLAHAANNLLSTLWLVALLR